MIPYEEMSEDAKRIFVTADLFGDGGKTYNAAFAAEIINAMCNMICHDWNGWEVVAHFRTIAAELEKP
jgi:hypothetical protein